jgi:hypothetical protein
VEEPVVVWLNEQDLEKLAIIEATGMSREDAFRAALTSLANDCTAVALAIGQRPRQRSTA